MIKVAIIGCGKIADVHAYLISTVDACEIIGVCDNEELMARQLAERFGVTKYFSSVNELLEDTRPDVIHITTPPQTHFEIGKACLEAGCHIYVEKPFALNARECEDLVQAAIDKRLKLTAGHDLQFTHAARRMRKLIGEGYLGGPPVHMESYYCYDLGDTSYARALVSDRNHWVRMLPGRLLHNLISHGISKIAEFMAGDDPEVKAYGFTSSMLKGINEDDIIDELRVIIKDKGDRTAYFTFSTQMRPALHHFRIYGPKNGLVIDDDHETIIKERGMNYKSYLNRFIPPIELAMQYLSNFGYGSKCFLRNKFHMTSGMRYLIEAFYKSVSEGTDVPIPYREIIITARIMDQIFRQLEMRMPGNGSNADSGSAGATVAER